MHIAPVDPNTSAVSHGGERYEPDEDGLFDVPQELAERLLQGPGWEVHVAAEPSPTLDLAELRAIAAKGAEAARLLEEAEAAEAEAEAAAKAEAEAAAKAAEEEAAKTDDESKADADKEPDEEPADDGDKTPAADELPIDDAPAKKTRTRAPKAVDA